MKTTTTTTAYAMTLLAPAMKRGMMKEDAAVAILQEHHACTVKTLLRAGLLFRDYNGNVMTADRFAADNARREKAAKVKALKAEIARLTAELEALQRG